MSATRALPLSALEQLTDVQTDALIATAERLLRPREELAAELLSLLYIEPSEPVTPATEIPRSSVKDPLTPTTVPIVAQPQEATQRLWPGRGARLPRGRLQRLADPPPLPRQPRGPRTMNEHDFPAHEFLVYYYENVIAPREDEELSR